MYLFISNTLNSFISSIWLSFGNIKKWILLKRSYTHIVYDKVFFSQFHHVKDLHGYSHTCTVFGSGLQGAFRTVVKCFPVTHTRVNADADLHVFLYACGESALVDSFLLRN